MTNRKFAIPFTISPQRIGIVFCFVTQLMVLNLFAQDTEGFHSIFDGKSLNGWNGDTELWRVEDGAIVGQTTDEKTIKSNQFLVWGNGEVDDFVLRVKFRISGTPQANSGIQFRSKLHSEGRLSGYQADIDRSGKYIGILYSEGTQRGILCERGQKATLNSGSKNQKETVADAAKILGHINLDDWNEFEVTAIGNRFVNKINGHVTAEVVDMDKELMVEKGALGFQLHVGPAMKIEFKDVRLKRLPLTNDVKKVVFVAGKASHGPGIHEHFAGCRLLAEHLDRASKENSIKTLTTVYRNGWPADPSAFDNADVIVCYCDGGGGHYLHKNLEAFKPVMDRGVGLVLLHYGVEAPKGDSGNHFLKWAGGYFETDWSVNPIWNAKFETLPDHPIARGIKPFEFHDEWYYHMRFPADMKGVTPILSALPPADSLTRPDGPHSNNPHVRKAVLEDKLPQHVGWAFVREDGKSRGFGFTGGHFHKSWQNDSFRKTILNAIVWTANLEVPENGVPSLSPTDEEMNVNQDEKKKKK